MPTKQFFVLLLIILVAIVGCHKLNNCDYYDCFTPPMPISIILMSDSLDIVYTGHYNKDSIRLYYYDADKEIILDLEIFNDSVNKRCRLISSDLTWKSYEGNRYFYLDLGSSDTDTLFVIVESVVEDCCTFHPITNFKYNDEKQYYSNSLNSFILNKTI